MTEARADMLRSLAVDTPLYLKGGPARVVDERFIVEIGPEPSPAMNIVSRLRFGEDDVERAVHEVRQHFLAAGRHASTWEVATGSTPAGLGERLLALGMTPDEPPTNLGLACTTEPASSVGDIAVERVETDEQFDEVRGIFEEGDDWSPGDEWLRGPGDVTRYLARIAGEAVATADITWLEHPDAVFLGGALTVPRARRRGAYRALVHHRWEAARGAGRSILVTQSEPMSQPILARLGFEPVGRIDIYVDRFGP
jgi:GNAT superfamily N-acetyltransferase